MMDIAMHDTAIRHLLPCTSEPCDVDDMLNTMRCNDVCLVAMHTGTVFRLVAIEGQATARRLAHMHLAFAERTTPNSNFPTNAVSKPSI
jgi:hypothetical protein